MSTSVRHAVYFAPAPDSPLWRFGSGVLGYDAATGADVPPIVPEGWSPADWHAATEDPRRYGFHATLKAPFRLADGASEGDLMAAAEDAARRLAPAHLADGLVARALGRFAAMVPATPSPGIAALEAGCVRLFEPLRAPLNEAEIQRRLRSPLTPEQKAYLAEWGYPYVFDQFRFHMTLSGSIGERSPATAETFQHMAEAAGVTGPTEIDRIVVFRQDGPQARFRIVGSFMLTGTGAEV